MAWLDALRGLAAVAVLAEHMLQAIMPSLRPYWCNLGIYGVMVFFLVSGYIIPVSLERRGDLRAFWISRAFRLYPLYVAVIGLTLALAWWIPVRDAVPRDPSAVAAHATMLTDVVGVATVVDPMWTLSYEMVFYLVCAAMYAAGVHTRGGVAALLFAGGAVLAGLLLSGPPLTGGWVVWASTVAFALGLACVVARRGAVPVTLALGIGAVALLFLSSRAPWFGAAILAVMFAGAAVHRWEREAGRLWPVGAAAVLVAVAPVWAPQAGWWWVQPDVWITTLAMAAATFAGVMAVRERWRIPRSLVWLGMVSYSLYLTHVPVLKLLTALAGDLRTAPPPVQALVMTLTTAAILLVSGLTYRLIELPAQRLGRSR
ncbi:Peptidoglycan/LPS O-acetylase OafA/YrhL, contains acyltransferase and SGNH-hydrolase domains [Nonomuraea solani]|uniref:Peptidoglycan/LPS O-acetylase OafA/YrhL, contains acyltransferase and SGNH-hydrolase domains n=2 Tax=Nonomuraea solani TaxID=1144553 RepID=A0A1H6E3Q0_9ACTN|nr:Peptidoglycan/LPS O-acetylase OafA/YrhL, contains acyltransferase and SGNH-hydrolase domains [Nonomuraea solani]